MPKLTPKRTFLLRQEKGDGKTRDVVAKRNVKIEVSDEEHRKFFSYFKEPYAVKKKALSVN